MVALVNADRLSEAEQRTQVYLKKFPDAGILWKVLSVALVRQGKDALSALLRTSELMPEDGEAHRNLGAALYDRGRWAEALASLQRALARQPEDISTLVDAANTLRQLHRPAEAVALYQRALQLDPREVEAQNNLGNALLELKRYGEAELCYQRAQALKPGNAQINCNLGFTQSAQRQPEKAVASFRQALVADPNLIDALNGLGNGLRELGDRRQAATLFRRAIELDEGRPESHSNLGSVLFETRRVDEAAASFRRALSLKADYVPAHLGLAAALRQQRRPDEAEASCQAALETDPHHVEAMCLLAELRADRGRFDQAEALFLRAIASEPECAAAYSGIAMHRRMTINDTAWLEGAQALAARRLPLAQQIGLEYALGKYFDDIKQYDRAFAHFAQANESTKRYGGRHDRDRLSRRVDQIIRRFDSQGVRHPDKPQLDSELPIFVVGMPRSGTSLAEQILASHPSVFGAGELVYWNNAYDTLNESGSSPETTAEVQSKLASDYLERLKNLGGGAIRVVDKMPANFWYLGLLHAAFPQARIIHMQRHPLDTCLSIYFQNFFNIGPYAHDLSDMAHFYGEYRRIMSHWRSVLPATALLEVPYEALVDAPEEWARRMLSFVGLPWDPACLDFHQTDRVVITASKWQVRQRISTSSVGRWKNYQKHLGPLQSLMDAAPLSPGNAGSGL